jgi:hypothetical protein
MHPERTLGEFLVEPPQLPVGAVAEVVGAGLALHGRDHRAAVVAARAQCLGFRHDRGDVSGRAVRLAPRHDQADRALVGVELQRGCVFGLAPAEGGAEITQPTEQAISAAIAVGRHHTRGRYAPASWQKSCA